MGNLGLFHEKVFLKAILELRTLSEIFLSTKPSLTINISYVKVLFGQVNASDIYYAQANQKPSKRKLIHFVINHNSVISVVTNRTHNSGKPPCSTNALFISFISKVNKDSIW